MVVAEQRGIKKILTPLEKPRVRSASGFITFGKLRWSAFSCHRLRLRESYHKNWGTVHRLLSFFFLIFVSIFDAGFLYVWPENKSRCGSQCKGWGQTQGWGFGRKHRVTRRKASKTKLPANAAQKKLDLTLPHLCGFFFKP